jgi:acetyl-CoA C-acetyltransferase
MMAFPYTKLHNSDWNVDQAAALILCSAEVATSLEIPRQQWIFPLAATESNHVVPLSARNALDRSPGALAAGSRLVELAGCRLDEVDYQDIYSCFPAPVRVFKRELALDAIKPFTVTGGMASAGGPLNNYVLQSTVRMAEILREDPGSRGLVTCVSGFMNKVGFCIWSSRAPEEQFEFADVTEEVAAFDTPRVLFGDYQGPATVVGYTVAYEAEAPAEGIAVCELPDGRRTIATTRDPDLAMLMTREEFCGKTVSVGAAGNLTL